MAVLVVIVLVVAVVVAAVAAVAAAVVVAGGVVCLLVLLVLDLLVVLVVLAAVDVTPSSPLSALLCPVTTFTNAAEMVAGSGTSTSCTIVPHARSTCGSASLCPVLPIVFCLF